MATLTILPAFPQQHIHFNGATLAQQAAGTINTCTLRGIGRFRWPVACCPGVADGGRGTIGTLTNLETVTASAPSETTVCIIIIFLVVKVVSWRTVRRRPSTAAPAK